MKKSFLLLIALLCTFVNTCYASATLIEVYQQALVSDQIFQQAISQSLVTKQGVPISLSAILPAISGTYNPYVTKTSVQGQTNFVGDNTVQGVNFNLNLTQTIFNFSQFANLAQQLSISKQATATVNAALQSLMLRVAKAYFAILQDEDTLQNVLATKAAYAKQLDQVTQQYKVGLKAQLQV
jgi:outer membrane protein